MKYYEYEELAGERIANWEEINFTIENGLKRKPDEDDFDDFGDTNVEWVFTQRGQRLHLSYVSKANRLGNKLFEEHKIDTEKHTGVLYP